MFLLSGSLALQILSLNAVKLLFLSFYSVYFHRSIILMQLCFHIFVTFIVTWEYFLSIIIIIIPIESSLCSSFFLQLIFPYHQPSSSILQSSPLLNAIFLHLLYSRYLVGMLDFVVICALCFGKPITSHFVYFSRCLRGR